MTIRHNQPACNPRERVLQNLKKERKDLKPHKATGLDNIPARLLKTAADELAPELSHLLQISVDNGKNPPGLGDGTFHSSIQEGQQIRPMKLPSNFSNFNCMQDIHSCIISHFQRLNILIGCQHGIMRDTADHDS